MQKLRSTFKRSRTPTGAEMKSQSSLEVPKQIRSASFDEIQLQGKREDDSRDVKSAPSSSSSMYSPARSQDADRRSSVTLKVPHQGQRSKSFDAYSVSSGSSGSQQFLGGFERPETPVIQVSGCYHCACIEEYKSLWLVENISREDVDEVDEFYDVDKDTDPSEYDSERGSETEREGSPEIRVTLTSDDVQDVSEYISPLVDIDSSSEIKAEFFETQRRRSLVAPKLSRQEALTSFPLELPAALSVREEEVKTSVEVEDDDDDEDSDIEASKSKFIVRDIFLTVPELKRDRAASVDSCFNNNKSGNVSDANLLAVPQQSIRSKSVDIVLPTDARTRYTALLPGRESRPSIGWVRPIDEAHDQQAISSCFWTYNNDDKSS